MQRTLTPILLFCLLTLSAPARAENKPDCTDYAKAVQQACRDELYHGRKADCANALMRMDIARKQARGDLFDVGENNVSTAHAVCRSNLKSLQELLAKNKKGSALSWAEHCSAFVQKIDKACIEPVGKKDLPSTCRQALGVLVRAQGQTPDQQEMQCKMMERMLKLE